MLQGNCLLRIWLCMSIWKAVLLTANADCPKTSDKGILAEYSNCNFDATDRVQSSEGTKAVHFINSRILLLGKGFLSPTSNVQELKFIDNYVESVEKEFLYSHKELKELEMKQKGINLSLEAYRDVFNGPAQLKTLELEIKSMCSWILNAINDKNLETLSIRNTLIVNKDPKREISFKKSYPKLKHLTIRNCGLEKIEITSNLSSLRLLDLSENSITDLKKINFAKMINLKKFVVSNNKIKTVAKGTFDKNLNLSEVDLTGNEFKAILMTQNGISASITFKITIDDNQVNCEMFKQYPISIIQYTYNVDICWKQFNLYLIIIAALTVVLIIILTVYIQKRCQSAAPAVETPSAKSKEIEKDEIPMGKLKNGTSPYASSNYNKNKPNYDTYCNMNGPMYSRPPDFYENNPDSIYDNVELDVDYEAVNNYDVPYDTVTKYKR